MEKMIAYCGIVCTECEAFTATHNEVPAALEKAAATWREQFDLSITAASIECDGCLEITETLCSYCAICPLRICAVHRGEKNCAYCTDFEGCEKLEAYFSHAHQMRDVLKKYVLHNEYRVPYRKRLNRGYLASKMKFIRYQSAHRWNAGRCLSRVAR